MNRKHMVLASALSVMIVVSSGVAFFDRNEDFDVVLINRDGGAVYDVRVVFDHFKFRFGDLREMPGELGQSSFLMHSGPWPKGLMVEWKERRDDSEAVRSVLDVPPQLAFARDEQLELVIEFREAGPVAYPRVAESFEEKGLSYRYKD